MRRVTGTACGRAARPRASRWHPCRFGIVFPRVAADVATGWMPRPEWYR